MMGLELGPPPGHRGEEVGAAEGPALKPRQRSSGTLRGRAAEADEATQSAKAPESDGNLLVVATTTDPDIFLFNNSTAESNTLLLLLLYTV